MKRQVPSPNTKVTVPMTDKHNAALKKVEAEVLSQGGGVISRGLIIHHLIAKADLKKVAAELARGES